MTDEELEYVQRRINYRFVNANLLRKAFIHASSVRPSERHMSNERLELLGDAVLELQVTQVLFFEMDHASEGELCSARSATLSNERLAEVASGLEFMHMLSVGKNQENIRSSVKTRADLVEAIIGAAYVDGHDLAARTVIDALGILR